METSARGHTAVQVVGGFYEAFLEGGERSTALRQLTTLLPCEHAVLATLTGGRWQWCASGGLAATEHSSMDQICQTFFSDIVGGQCEDAVVRTGDVVNLHQLQRSDFYYAHLRPLRGGRSLMVHGDIDGERIAMAFCRPLEHGADFGDADTAMAQVVWPHVKRAHALHRARRADSVRTSARSAINALPAALIGLSARGQVLLVNHGATELLQAHPDLRIQAGHLVARRAHEDARLRSVLEAALAPPYRAGAVILSAGRAAAPGALHAAALTLQVQPCSGDTHRQDDIAAWVVLRDARRVRVNIGPLRAAFGLTQREAEVAACLCTGRILVEVATDLGIAPDSVRQHLKAVFSKTHTRGQSELVSLLLRAFG